MTKQDIQKLCKTPKWNTICAKIENAVNSNKDLTNIELTRYPLKAKQPFIGRLYKGNKKESACYHLRVIGNGKEASNEYIELTLKSKKD